MNSVARVARALDITVLRIAIAAMASAVLAIPSLGQNLDATLDDIIDGQIDRQVEDELVETLEDFVEQQVEDQIASEIADSVEEVVESDVVDSIEEQIEAGVTEGIAEQVAGAVTQAVEQGLGELLDRAGDVVDEVGQNVGDAANETLDGDGAGAAANAADERYFEAVDDAGRRIERDVWVILVPAEHAARIEGWGFMVRERRDLATIDRVLLRVDAPEDRDIAQAALDLALDAPGTLVDFNHVYRDGAGSTADAAAGAPIASPTSVPGTHASLAIGIVDSAVAVDHDALRAADVVQRDFVSFDAKRPLRHGTAVASILVGESRSLHGQLRAARLYAACVFFEDDAGNPAATTASLVVALEWLVGEGVRVVNMSLAGPPNRVLEAAIGEVTARGAVIVAAVGNNGPVGEPLYPAAYESVVGVTAVDSSNRIYRYANRGRQVTFAAPGVRIKIAASGGGYDSETGTSMAAPHAAAIIARSLDARATQSVTHVLAALKAAAIDLGAKDFDDVFGFGLIAAVD